MLAGAVVRRGMAPGRPEDVHPVLRGGAHRALGTLVHVPELPVNQDLVPFEVIDLAQEPVVHDERPIPDCERAQVLQVCQFHDVIPPDIVQCLADGVEVHFRIGGGAVGEHQMSLDEVGEEERLLLLALGRDRQEGTHKGYQGDNKTFHKQ